MLLLLLPWLFSADIGHVDFLEMVYKQAEKAYVIVGLHFDQVYTQTVNLIQPKEQIQLFLLWKELAWLRLALHYC